MTTPLDWDDGDCRDESETETIDRLSLLWMLATIILIAAAVWLRFGPGLFPKLIQIGEPMPPTRLTGLHDTDSRLLLGHEGEVLWLVFLPEETSPVLAELEAVWNRLRPDGRFVMVIAAVASDGVDQARLELEPYRGSLPLYLAGREAPRAFGIDPHGEPWHFLIDPKGRVAALARGSNRSTVDRLAKMADDWLESLAPASEIRFRLTYARNDVATAETRKQTGSGTRDADG